MTNTDVSYNLEKHIELIKLEREALNQDKDFFKEDESKALILSEYDVLIEYHIFWEDRFTNLSIIQAFLNKEMSCQEFHDSVFGMRYTLIEKCKEFRSKLASGEMKDFSPKKEECQLKDFLSQLYWDCEFFEIDSDENEFYNSLQDILLEFQKIVNEE